MIDENKLRALIINSGGCDAKDDYSRGWDDAIEEVLDILDNQPKVGEWIPVSERLPEHATKVCLSLESSDPVLVAVIDENGNTTTSVDFLIEDTRACALNDNSIIAWQPLPEPYKEE